MAKKKKYYVVWHGNETGVFDSWTQCQLQIKGFPNAKYKSFASKEEAEKAYAAGFEFSVPPKTSKPKKNEAKPETDKSIDWDSISVDAACSGNPGIMEYQGVHTQSKEQIFYKKFSIGTNNIGEFLSIVHALAQLKNEGKKTSIYSDSKIAMGWVKQKKCKTKLKVSVSTQSLHLLIKRAEKWLNNNSYSNLLLKWDTKKWGEIPADFGRK